MDSLDADRNLVKGSVEDLSVYLDSNELFWPLSTPGSGARNTIALTIGNLLLSMERLKAIGRLQELDGAIRIIMAIKESRKTVWILKSAREFIARTNLWKSNLKSFLNDTNKETLEYAGIIKGRVILELLKTQLMNERAAFEVVKREVPLAGKSMNLLDELDMQLKAFPSSEFIWDKQLTEYFPREIYWFLYRAPNSPKGGM
jgi:hypothetical protein